MSRVTPPSPGRGRPGRSAPSRTATTTGTWAASARLGFAPKKRMHPSRMPSTRPVSTATRAIRSDQATRGATFRSSVAAPMARAASTAIRIANSATRCLGGRRERVVGPGQSPRRTRCIGRAGRSRLAKALRRAAGSNRSATSATCSASQTWRVRAPKRRSSAGGRSSLSSRARRTRSSPVRPRCSTRTAASAIALWFHRCRRG